MNSCSLCCTIATYKTKSFIGTANVLDISLSILLIISMSFMLFKMSKLYRNSLIVDFTFTSRFLINSARSEEEERKSLYTFVLPEYYTLSIVVAVWFIIQSIVVLPNSSPLLNTIKFLVFAVCASIDNYLALFLTQRYSSKKIRRNLFIVCIVIMLLYIIFVYTVPIAPKNCDWCGLHFPTSYIIFPYIAEVCLFLFVAFTSKKSVFGIEARPMGFIWGIFLTVCYGFSVIGMTLLFYGNISFGYCFMSLGAFIYTAGYAFLIYFISIRDSNFCVKYGRVKDVKNTHFAFENDEKFNFDQEFVEKEYQVILRDPSVKLIRPKDLNILDKIGAGGYGEVWLAEYSKTYVAVKRIFQPPSVDDNNPILHEFLHEIKVLSQLRHPNIVLFMGVCLAKNNESVITEYVSGGSLFDVVHTKKAKLTPKQVIRYSLQCAKAIFYLHSGFNPSIIHRDLKTPNLLLGENDVIKVCDFGLSRTKESKTMTKTGTVQWTAPEVIKEEYYSEKADVFSFGVILWELVHLTPPYINLSIVQVIKLILDGERLKISDNCPNELREIIVNCWEEEYEKRPTFETLAEQIEEIIEKADWVNFEGCILDL